MVVESATALGKLVEVLGLAPKLMAAIALISGAMLFLPESVLDHLGIMEIKNQYRLWAGMAFLVSSGSLLVHALWMVPAAVHRFRLRSEDLKGLQQLPDDEKVILKRYIVGRTHSQNLRFFDPPVRSLAAKGYLVSATNIGDIKAYPTLIQPWVWRYLDKHPELLRLDSESRQGHEQ